MTNLNTFAHPSQQVLQNSDILLKISGLLDNHSLTQYARVCKAWFDLAANFIWRDVSGLAPIIALLVPHWPEHVSCLNLATGIPDTCLMPIIGLDSARASFTRGLVPL